jgi:hypothetical protein
VLQTVLFESVRENIVFFFTCCSQFYCVGEEIAQSDAGLEFSRVWGAIDEALAKV